MPSKKVMLKKTRPFWGLILFVTLVLISTAVVFFSAVSVLVYPLAWVVFYILNVLLPARKKIIYCLNAVSWALCAYVMTICALFLWKPNWLKVLSRYLENKTWWNVFQEGTYMCGRVCVAFLLSLVVLFGFIVHYKWAKKRELAKTEREENQAFFETSN